MIGSLWPKPELLNLLLTMLSVNECRKFLKNDENQKLTDKEVEIIRDYFYEASGWIISYQKTKNDGKKKSNSVHKGIDR
ncbi:MAG: hypothetical protein K8R53_03630 [Bacteroidales bacterium]|nr:hypothetical protein [Bacteroidales bacterium]